MQKVGVDKGVLAHPQGGPTFAKTVGCWDKIKMLERMISTLLVTGFKIELGFPGSSSAVYISRSYS